jgi:general secretion pathway protein L
MNILCIDLGNYALKFLYGRTEGKDFKIKDFKKIDLTPHLDHPNLDELEDPEQYKTKIEERNQQRLSVQLEFIREYIQEEDFEGKILLTLPESLVTTRYIELPINNRKKAELMIPFQLDGNLPFSMNDTHWASSLFKNTNGYQAQVYITKIEEFDQFFSKLSYSNVEVATLAPPMSYWQSAIPELGMQGHAIIIDLGHEMINAYHLINQRVVTNHTSYYAGRSMDEFIAHSFSLDIEQVNELKLQKATFLPDQFDPNDPDISEAEKSMDLLVKQFFYPIMKEIKRWIIGHQVKFNHPIEMIYITGGMSNIPGIKEFIEANFHVPIRGIEYRNLPFILPSKIYTMDFGLCLAMAQSQISKQPVANLLKGQYQSSFQVTIPLTSSSFIITRAAIFHYS